MKEFIVAVAAVGLALLGASRLVYELDPSVQAMRAWTLAANQAQSAAIQPYLLVLKQAAISAGVVAVSSTGVAVAIGALAVAGAILRRVDRVYPLQGGMMPSLLVRPGWPDYLAAALAGRPLPEPYFLPAPNQHNAQVAYAVFGARGRVTAGVARALMNPRDDEALLPEPEVIPQDYDPGAIVKPDPQNNPDTLIVGKKGSGKTNTLRYIIEAYRRNLPGAEYIFLSRFASNWPDIEVISEPREIFDAVVALRAEMDRRDQLMKELKISDYHRWPDAPPNVVVVVDEAEAAADDLSITDARLAREFGKRLRALVNMGRNAGFMFIVGTQTARADVLDPAFMRNASHVFMMRMDTATAARFAVYGREVTDQLLDLPIGRAYCPQVNGWVQFPLTNQLKSLRHSTIYRPRLALPADAEADGLGSADQPSTVQEAVLEPIPAPVPAPDPLYEAARTGKPIPVPDTDNWPPWLASTVYNNWLAADRNLSAAQRHTFGYDGGRAYYVAAECINEALRRRGLDPRYKSRSAA
jgi:hypothetical protein